MQAAHHFDQLLHRRTLYLSQMGVPAIHQQDDARLRRTIPCFMLKGVVEHHQFSLSPVMRSLVDQIKSAIWRHHERQMHDQTNIAHSVVGQDVGSRL